MKLLDKSIVYATVVAVCICVSFASGQTEKNTNLDSARIEIRANKVSFAKALGLLADQSGLSIIADDVPQRAEADLEAHGTARQALDLIGDRFDYTWTQSGDGTIRLCKRFESGLEHPQIHRADAAKTIKDSLRVLSALGDKPDVDAMGTNLRALYATFTPEQLKIVSDGRSLPVRGLSPGQQNIVHAAMTNAAYGRTFDLWNLLDSQVAGLEDSSVRSVVPRPGTFLPNAPIVKPDQQNDLKPLLFFVWRDVGGETSLPVPHTRGLLIKRRAHR